MKSFSSFIIGAILFVAIAWPATAWAHCPLCTAGAGAAALLASWLGVGSGSIGVFIGAFAFAIGLWIAKMIQRRYLPYQNTIIGLTSFIGTVVPLTPLLSDYSSLYISWVGDYGTLFNRTYLLNTFLIGSVIGALLLLVAPHLSRVLTRLRKQQFPYQGVMLTIFLLFGVSALLELFL